MIFKDDTCKAYHDEKGLFLASSISSNQLFPITAAVVMPKCLQASSEDETYLWHCRYGHLSLKGLKILLQKEMVTGLPNLEESRYAQIVWLINNTGISKEEQLEVFKKIGTFT